MSETDLSVADESREAAAETDAVSAALEAEINEQDHAMQPGSEVVLPYEKQLVEGSDVLGVLVIGGRRLAVTGDAASETITLVTTDDEGRRVSRTLGKHEKLELGAYGDPDDGIFGIYSPVASIHRSGEGLVVQCEAPGAMVLRAGETTEEPAVESAESSEASEHPFGSEEDNAEGSAVETPTSPEAPDADDIFSSPQRLLEVVHNESVDSETRRDILHCLSAWAQLENDRMARNLWQTLEQDNPGGVIENDRVIFDRMEQARDGVEAYVVRLSNIVHAIDLGWSESERIAAFKAAVDEASHVANLLSYDDTVTRFREAMVGWARGERAERLRTVDTGVNANDPQLIERLIQHRQPGETPQQLAERLRQETEANGADYQRELFRLARELGNVETKSEESIVYNLRLAIQDELESLRYPSDPNSAADTIARLADDTRNRIGAQFTLLRDLAEKIYYQRQLQRQNQS